MKKIFCLILSLLLLSSLLPTVIAANDNVAIYVPEAMTGRDAWEVSVSSTITNSRDYIRNIIDGNPSTYWHSYYKHEGTTITYREAPPHDIDITLPQEVATYGFIFTTRQDNNTSGLCTAYRIYGKSASDTDWVFLCEGTMDSRLGRKTVTFSANVLIKEFRFEVTDSIGGYGTCAELELLLPFENAPTLAPSEYAAYDATHALSPLPSEEMFADCETPIWEGHPTKMILDGSASTFWQTDGTKDAVILTVAMGDLYTVSAIDVIPRQSSDFHGTWLGFSIWTSTDGENYDLAYEDLHLERSLAMKRLLLDTPITARYIQFEIYDGFASRASCAELVFYQSAEEANKVPEHEEYQLRIGDPTIHVKHGEEEKTVMLDVAPYIDSGYTLIPLRGLLEEMGATVTWQAEDESVTVKTAAQTILFQIWYNLVFVTGGRYGTVRYTLNQPPRILDERTFIPLRFVSEHLGYTVDWDGETQTITISK